MFLEEKCKTGSIIVESTEGGVEKKNNKKKCRFMSHLSAVAAVHFRVLLEAVYPKSEKLEGIRDGWRNPQDGGSTPVHGCCVRHQPCASAPVLETLKGRRRESLHLAGRLLSFIN